MAETTGSESLREKQSRFALQVSKLIDWVYANGYELTFGECYRTPEQAEWNAAHGSGIRNSLHTKRLAIDLNLFRDGDFLAGMEDYRPLGEYWESLSPDHAWGGRFSKPDADHFSIAHEGVR